MGEGEGWPAPNMRTSGPENGSWGPSAAIFSFGFQRRPSQRPGAGSLWGRTRRKSEAEAGRPRVTVVGDDFVGALRILLDDLLNAARLDRATEFSFSLEFV